MLILTIILCFLTSYWGFSVKWLHFIFPQKDEVKFAGSHQYSRRSRREGLGRSEKDIGTFLANNSDRQHCPRLECLNCRFRQKDKTLISILFLDFCKRWSGGEEGGGGGGGAAVPEVDHTRLPKIKSGQCYFLSNIFTTTENFSDLFLYWNQVQEIKSSILGSAIFCLSSLHCQDQAWAVGNFHRFFKISVFKSLLMRRPPGAESGCFTPRVWPRVPIWGGEFNIYQQNILIRFVWVISWGGEFDISAKHLDLFE